MLSFLESNLIFIVIPVKLNVPIVPFTCINWFTC